MSFFDSGFGHLLKLSPRREYIIRPPSLAQSKLACFTTNTSLHQSPQPKHGRTSSTKRGRRARRVLVEPCTEHVCVTTFSQVAVHGSCSRLPDSHGHAWFRERCSDLPQRLPHQLPQHDYSGQPMLFQRARRPDAADAVLGHQPAHRSIRLMDHPRIMVSK